MIQGKPISIVGSGKYLPTKVLSSDIEKKYGLPEGWSEKYSGVYARHQVTFETGAYMGAMAVAAALERANMSLKDVDMLISAGATFDYPLPHQASLIKKELKDGDSVHIATLHIDSSCLSFVSALEVAAGLLDGKQYKNIVVVSSEIASKGLNPAVWECLTLFGDGAAAFILRYDETVDAGFIKAAQNTYSDGAMHSIIKGGGNAYFFKDHPYTPELHSFAMNGKALLLMASKKLPLFVDAFFQDIPFQIDTVDHIIPHQASKVGNSILTKLYPIATKVKNNLLHYGNCIAASIPLVLHDAIENGEIQSGDTCLLIGTAAGFSIGGLLFRY